MRRKLMDKLLKWKEDKETSVCSLLGASGVGKSYLAYEFAKSFYKQFIYLDFKKNKFEIERLLHIHTLEHLNQLLEKEQLSTEENGLELREIDQIQLHMDLNSLESMEEGIEPLLIIIDHFEIVEGLEENERLLFLRKATDFIDFIKNKVWVRLLIISKEISPAISNLHSELILSLYPLDFEEYLLAFGHQWYIDTIKVHYNSNTKLPDIVHKQLLQIFEQYLAIGGMPLAVNHVITTNSTFNLSYTHNLIQSSYLYENLNKREGEGQKVNQISDSIPLNLMKVNKKFQYTTIRKGATYSLYRSALNEIQKTFHGFPCVKLNESNIEDIKNGQTFLDTLITANTMDYHNIKLYGMDVGMLNSQMSMVEESDKQVENSEDISHLDDTRKPGIVENYVAIHLASKGYPLYFWESTSMAKIEFIIKKEERIIPVEVRCNDKTRSKNFSVYKSQFSTGKEQIKISSKNFEYANRVKYIPLYAVFCI